MDDFYEFLQTFFGLITDAGSLAWEHVVDYKNFLWRLTKWFALFAAIPIPVLIICLIFRWPVNWLYSAYFIFVGAEAVILIVLAFPIIAAAQIIFDRFPQFAGSIRKSVQGIAAVAFWALMLAVYFYVFPIQNNPMLVPLVLMAAVALALGTYAGLVRLPFGSVQKIATVFLVGTFVIATFAFSFPNRMRQLAGFTQNIDIVVVQPKRLNISYEDIENQQIAFFRSDGKPLVWYCETADGRIELFDNGGYHPIYKVELKPVTPDIVSQIKEQLKKDAVKESEKQKAEETERAFAAKKKFQEEQKKQQAAQELERQKAEETERAFRERKVGTGPALRAPAIEAPEEKALKGRQEQARIAFAENAIGQWFNVSKTTRGTTKLVISRNGEKWLIQGWGACHPTDCDWGTVPLFMGGESVEDKSFTHGIAIWDFGFSTVYVTLKIKNDSLITENITIFKDGSGRSNYFQTEEFKR